MSKVVVSFSSLWNSGDGGGFDFGNGMNEQGNSPESDGSVFCLMKIVLLSTRSTLGILEKLIPLLLIPLPILGAHDLPGVS
jgi:hypothetical protein